MTQIFFIRKFECLPNPNVRIRYPLTHTHKCRNHQIVIFVCFVCRFDLKIQLSIMTDIENEMEKINQSID